MERGSEIKGKDSRLLTLPERTAHVCGVHVPYFPDAFHFVKQTFYPLNNSPYPLPCHSNLPHTHPWGNSD